MGSKSPIRQITCFSTGFVLIFVLIVQSNCENFTRSQISVEKASSSNLSSLNISSLPGKTPKKYQGSWNQSRSLGSQPPQTTKNDARVAQQNVKSSIPFGNATRNADASANLQAASLRTNSGLSPFNSSRRGNNGTRPTSSSASKTSKAVSERQKWNQRGKSPTKAQPDPNEDYKYIWWPLQVNYYPYKKGFKRVLGIPGKFNGNFAASTFPYSSATKYGPLKSFQSQTYVPDSVPYIWEKNRYKHFHTR